MKPYYQDDAVTLLHSDCRDVLPTLPDCSVDAVVCDPPYGLEFMGREWDSFRPAGKIAQMGDADGTPFRRNSGTPAWGASGNPSCLNCGGDKYRNGARKCSCDSPSFPNHMASQMSTFQAWCEQWAAECLRVLKPGGHLLAFGGTRTWHRLTVAIEDAGFEVRDSIAWLYGSGFPKSLNVSKAISTGGGRPEDIRQAAMGDDYAPSGRGRVNYDHGSGSAMNGVSTSFDLTEDAARWQGWGTALKPAFEPIVVARKPLAGTVAGNVLQHGTGALNIDGCRVGTASGLQRPERRGKGDTGGWADYEQEPGQYGTPDGQGRWPANVLLDESQAEALDEQSGTSVSPATVTRGGSRRESYRMRGQGNIPCYDDMGGASRFFPTFRYEAKAPTAERPRDGQTAHPTVKPLDLMRWLVRLVTPPGGTVLDPFAGSGTTAEACVIEGFRCITIEREADYLPLIVARLTKPIEPVLDFSGGAA